MRKVLLYVFLSLVVASITGFLLSPQNNQYEEDWKQVEQYVEKGLPRSALEVVDKIYRSAKKEGNEPQLIKSLIYRISLQSRFEEEHINGAIQLFEKELKTAKAPEKQILHSLVAELYHWYYQQNRWQINDRGVVVDFEPEDLTSWDAVMINKTIRQHYLQSVRDQKTLENIPLGNFAAILNESDSSDFTLWPSLFDLLGNRALNYFSTSDAGLAEMGELQMMDNDSLLTPAPEFIQLNLKIADSASATFQVLRLYQRLLAFHLETGNIQARVDLDLNRLQYLLNQSGQEQTSAEAYIQTVEQLREDYKSNPVYIQLSAVLARKYMEKSTRYVAGESNAFRYDLNKAEQICKEALEAFPDAKDSGLCKNIINEINRVEFDFQIENAVYPGKPILSHLSYRNLDKLYFKIVSIDPGELLDNENKEDRKTKIQRYLNNATVQKWFQKLPQTGDHQKHTTEAIIPALESGYYMLFASTDDTFEIEHLVYRPFWVTKLSYISKNNPEDASIDLFILDRKSGNPVSGIGITAYEKHYNQNIRRNEYLHAGDFTTDKAGYAKLDFGSRVKNASISFMLGTDCERMFSESDFFISQRENVKKLKTKTYLFTDRAIYRPGQTVYFKGIVVDKDGNEVVLKTGYSTQLEFRNVNRKEIGTLDVTTNEFGSFQGVFVIPTGGLNGQMTLRTSTGSVGLLVEEYKRPTFSIVFDTVKGEYKSGQEVNVTGTAETFTGSSVMNATVTYRVVRSQMITPFDFGRGMYRPYPYVKPQEIANGKVTTDVDGRFSISFVAEAGHTNFPGREMPWQFTVYTDVTDITGEVQSASTQVMVGENALIIALDAGEKIRKESDEKIKLMLTNLSGAPLESSVEIKLFQLDPLNRVIVSRYWPEPDTYSIEQEEFTEKFPHLAYKKEAENESRTKQLIKAQTIAVNGQAVIFSDALSNAEAGEYLIVATATTATGDTVEAKRYFSLYSLLSKNIPGKPAEWFHLSKQKAEPGETIQLAIGSAGKKSKIFYEVVNGKKVVESDWVVVSNGQKIIDIPVRESYRGNFMVNVHMVRYNRHYARSFTVEVPFSNKKLDISLATHRDFLRPGNKEEWQVKITGPEGGRLAAELMAGMYDASLDQFTPHAWDMSLYQPRSNDANWRSGYFNAGRAFNLNPPLPHPFEVNPVNYPSINWYGYQHYSGGALVRTDIMMQKATPADGQLQIVEEDAGGITEKEEGEAYADSIPPATGQEEEEQQIQPPRTNFSETAFFYPQMKTDSLGNVVFSFTTPDALTEWKVLMLAHTGDLKVGTFVEKIKARKELMVIPNLPRFVRQGDRLFFTAKVVNLSDTKMNPEVTIEFFDPVSGDLVSVLINREISLQRLDIPAGQSAAVSWEISIPDNLSMLAYRISATSNNFSDSEERMIPVLTNRMLVTETLPMPVKGMETKQFAFDKLVISDKIMAVSTRKNYRYTVEFTSNPAWYAVQALPYLSEPTLENAGNLFHRYYANALSSFIINSNPRIRSVFESWRNITPESFYSNLQKNEELKNVVLNATPWVLEAEDEAEQKRRIGILFDMNRIANEKDNALAKLAATQLTSGAWPWFKGLHEDRHVTQNILLGIGKLVSKQVVDFSDNRDLKSMTRKAVNYIDDRVAEDYEKLKKKNPKGMNDNHLGTSQIEYLYARSMLLDEFPVSQKSQVAYEYYLGQAKKYWLKKSNYLQGMIALTMYRTGSRNEAEAILRSLKERSLQSDEMGMYWRQELSWHWYEAPVEAQALLIEAFSQIMNDPKSVEQMKVWLLKQKQTTNWKTSAATAEAVYALLLTGNDLLSEDKLVEVKVGSKTIVPADIEGMKVEAGTGYFKTAWRSDEINAAMGNIEVSNPNNTIAWGAAYWQYFENLDRITGHDTPLTIEKMMFVETLTKDGPVMKPLAEGQALHTGDKVIVRLVVGTDRVMEYVHLKDMRASALEPMEQLSGYDYRGGLGFYRNITDVSTEFFIQFLNKGTYVLEYPLMVTQRGEFSNGIATIQSYYAPEFAAHSEGKRITIK